MKTPKEFYEHQRLLGLTDDITCNPDPDYSQAFYRNIFRLMADYVEHHRDTECHCGGYPDCICKQKEPLISP